MGRVGLGWVGLGGSLTAGTTWRSTCVCVCGGGGVGVRGEGDRWGEDAARGEGEGWTSGMGVGRVGVGWGVIAGWEESRVRNAFWVGEAAWGLHKEDGVGTELFTPHPLAIP